MISKIIKLFVGIVIIALILLLYPIGKLMFTKATVSKSIFMNQYYMKITSDTNEYKVLSEYMESKGWSENEDRSTGGLHIFERDGISKEIKNNDIKTVIIDGKFNFPK